MTLTRIVSYDTAPPSMPTAQAGRGNAEAMQSLENDTTVSHPSHSPLEDADGAARLPHSHRHDDGFYFSISERTNARVGHGKVEDADGASISHFPTAQGTPTPHPLKEDQP